jgi:3-methyladenine DNA glycosylase AlkC
MTLYEFLPKEYSKSIQILKSSFKDINYSFSLENMIFQDFVEVYGLEDINLSLKALECFTINSSSEFAIRKFILKYPNKSMIQMNKWAKNTNEHIRRLSSEGCRPMLPWAIALPQFKKNPSEILDILNILKDDKSKYVLKSVANNINDISKDNPQIVIDLASRWINKNSSRNWMLKHGCRSLLKNGNRDILDFFGFKKNNDITIKLEILKDTIKMGESIHFLVLIKSKKNLKKLRVEYKMSFVRLYGKVSNKVFKISEGVFDCKTKEFSKFYSFKKISTRKYYTGEHKISIIINGINMVEKKFIIY